ncbi:hypothetical protein Leryth_001682 [Lithospermum erythrorhizon]|nr:hypothetical protein Leryth_001682 [Lithospermum erythrorhizon]
MMNNSRFMFIIGSNILMLVATVGGRGQPGQAKPACNFPAIYNFGDSNSDTGGISAVFLPIPIPYGNNFFKRPSGRDCDGRLIIDFIAEHLGLPYLSAYLNSIGSNYRHGANFATGGSTIRRQNETIFEAGISPFSLDVQTTMHFDQFRWRTHDLFSQANSSMEREKLPMADEFSRALYTFDIGQNDLSAGFRKLSNEQLKTALPDIVNQLAGSVTHLYQQGARTFWIHNTGPIGCLPVATLYIRNPSPGYLDKFGCISSQNEMAMEFNNQLKARVDKLRIELPEASLVYVDIYAAKYGLISNTNKHGFTDPKMICCGRHDGDLNIWCGNKAMVNGSEVFGGSCADPSTYVSWDGVHYSQAANQWVANLILSGSYSDPPMPVTHACYKHL